MTETKVGKVIHYFDRIDVAILELTGDLTVGDNLKFVKGGEVVLEQEVASMQIEHEPVDSAGAGQSIGLKTPEKVKEGAEVFKTA